MVVNRCRKAIRLTALLFLLAPMLASGAAVDAWEGTITIPTYDLGPADPNPSFPLINRKNVYPYTMLDSLTDHKIQKTYRAIYLENQYLKLTILPDLGGHLYSVYDKIDHREVLYRNRVVKYGLVGARGAWISGGMEFSFPYAHTNDTVSPVEYVLQHHPDGSSTAIVGAIDWVSNMHWEIALTLRPETARVEEQVTLFNSTPQDHLYLFWTNTAVKATDDMQYIYPMRETISDDPFAIVQSWPVWHGVDRSWYKNNPDAIALFARASHRNFFGVYYHRSNYGVVHVADFRQDPGKKIWSWGTAPSGKIWDHILSDDDGPYNEIQSGRFYTQGYREFMNPRRVEKWTEYWYPVCGLDGGFVEATSQMAVNVIYPGNGQGRPAIKLIVSPVADIPNASVRIQQGSTLLREFRGVHLAPLHPVIYTIPLQSSIVNAKRELNVEIQSAQGKVLLQWHASGPIDGNPDLVDSAGTALEAPIPDSPHTPVEALYRRGIFLQKSGNMQGALKVYDEVLQRDPGYVPALQSEAWYQYRAANFQKAASLLARAFQRSNENPSARYAAGVVYRAQGRLSLAKNSFWASIHYGGPPAPAFVELGEIEMRQGQYEKAAVLLQRAVSYNPQDAFALADLAAAERLAGNLQKAAMASSEAVQRMPLLPYALAERSQVDAITASDPKKSVSKTWTRIFSSDPQNYLAVASWYHDLGAWQSSDAVLHAAQASLSSANLSPMIEYYLASNARQEGRLKQARQDADKASSMRAADFFPNRITDAAVLKEAIQDHPSDVHAEYALGNFLFAHQRYDAAADLWTRALNQGMKSPVLLRNLGVYQWRVKDDLTSAASFYQRAIQLNANDYRLYVDLDGIYEQAGNSSARAALFQNAPPGILAQDSVRARDALFSIEQGDPRRALELLNDHTFRPWEGGVVVHNMFVRANIEMGERALENHRPQDAEQAFQKAMQYPETLGTGEPSNPVYAEQLYWLGNALQTEGKTSEAQAAWQKAAEQGRNRTNLSAVFSALAFQKLGQSAIAQQILERCISSATGPGAKPEAYFVAGMAERYTRHANRARSDFQHALQMDPSFWQARVALNAMNGFQPVA